MQERLEADGPDPALPERPAPGPVRRFYRWFRWVALAGTVIALFLILRQPAPPRLRTDGEASQRLEAKLREMDAAARSGRPYSLRMNEAELNSWMGSNLAFAREKDTEPPNAAHPPGTIHSDDPGKPLDPGDVQPPATVEEVQSTVRDVKIALNSDVLRAFVTFDFHGKDLTLVLEGRVFVEEGYIRLEPTHMQLGSLPIPGAMVEEAVKRLFESPENRESFRLPPGIADIRVANSQLIVTRK